MRSLVRRVGKSLDPPLEVIGNFKTRGGHRSPPTKIVSSQKVLPGRIEVKEPCEPAHQKPDNPGSTPTDWIDKEVERAMGIRPTSGGA